MYSHTEVMTNQANFEDVLHGGTILKNEDSMKF